MNAPTVSSVDAFIATSLYLNKLSSAVAAKLADAFGGKMEAAYWFSSGSDYDGMVIWLLPNDVAGTAMNMTTRSSGNFSAVRTITLLTGGVQGSHGESQERQVELDAADTDQITPGIRNCRGGIPRPAFMGRKATCTSASPVNTPRKRSAP